MELLLYEKAYNRVRRELDAYKDLDFICLTESGSFVRRRKGDDAFEDIPAEAVDPDIAWGSTDLFMHGPVRAFMVALLKGSRTRWLHSSAAGFDNPVFGTLVDKGLRLSNSNGQAIAMAEFVIAGVLDIFQPQEKRRAAQQRHEWERHPFREIWNTGWLIIGFGSIGEEVARRAKAFGAHVTGVRRSAGSHPLADRMIRPADLTQALPDADVVVIAAPLTPETKGLVGRDFLARMKPASVLVNVGRGPIVDETALLAALDAGTPGAALLDVFETEPLPPESPLWDHPNVRISPHASAMGSGTTTRNDRVFLENLSAYLSDGSLPREVAPETVKMGLVSAAQ